MKLDQELTEMKHSIARIEAKVLKRIIIELNDDFMERVHEESKTKLGD
jgi:hypothetical protein